MSTTRKSSVGRVIQAALASLLALPGAAAACPMCLAAPGGGTSQAFAIGSLFLSVIPLVVVGAAVWYLRRRARALREVEDVDAVSRPTAPLSS